MKILHVSGAKIWGGNEQQLFYIIERLDQEGVEQYLFCFDMFPRKSDLEQFKIKLISIPKVKPYKKVYRTVLKNIIDSNQINLIHLHTSDSVTGFVVSDLLIRLNCKTLFSKQGINRNVSFLSKLKYNYKGITHIVCVSKLVKDHFKDVLWKRNHQKLSVVHNGIKRRVDVSAFSFKKKYAISSDKQLIGTIANHTKAKDLFTYIKCIHFLIYELEYTNVHFFQLGTFSKLTLELKELVKELKVEDYITFTDFISNAHSYLPQFDVCLITSEREGGPSTLLDAFKYKTPVVSTRVGMVPEAIIDGVNGYILQPKDYEGLAHKLKFLLEHTEKRNEFATNSYHIFEQKFTADQLGINMLEIYKYLEPF